MAIFFGLHSSLIHFVSTWSWSSPLLSSVVFCAIFSATRIPTPPPLLFGLGLWIHLYPLTEICSFFFSWVSVMSAIDIFSVFRVVSRLFILPLIPLTFMVAMVISLFFLILGLRFFLCLLWISSLYSLSWVGVSLASCWFAIRVRWVIGSSSQGWGSFVLFWLFGFWVAFLGFHSLFSPSSGAGCHFLCWGSCLSLVRQVGCLLLAGVICCLILAGDVGCLSLAGGVGCHVLAG